MNEFTVVEETVDDDLECTERSRLLPVAVECCKQGGCSARRAVRDLNLEFELFTQSRHNLLFRPDA